MRHLDARDRVVLVALMTNAAMKLDEPRLARLGFPMGELRTVIENPRLLNELRHLARTEVLRERLQRLGEHCRIDHDEYLFDIEIQPAEDDAWYSLAGVRHGPFFEPRLLLHDIEARVEMWQQGAQSLGGYVWRPRPLRVVVRLPRDTVVVEGDVEPALRRAWTAIRRWRSGARRS